MLDSFFRRDYDYGHSRVDSVLHFLGCMMELAAEYMHERRSEKRENMLIEFEHYKEECRLLREQNAALIYHLSSQEDIED